MEDVRFLEGEDVDTLSFPVVGIGASAGGLEAVTSMFRDIKANTGLAYVLILHLDPNHESLMAELLSRKTQVEVRQITDGDPIQPDCLHVIPPGYSLVLEHGAFKLEPFEEPRGLRRPIDSFFASLAETQRENAACVILSGTGADGSAGLRVIKEQGGVCAVQKPDQASYDGMPFSALSTNAVDFTLAAEEIIPRLKLFFDGAFRPEINADTDDGERALQQIFDILHERFGHDFSGYKRSTLFRRLERRLQVQEIEDVDEYIASLTRHPNEQLALFQDFLINVTAFFRDTEAFQSLDRKVIENLVREKDRSDEIRVWIPGCSSGQEAYSIAILLDHACKELGRSPLIQVFATDLDETMIAQARRAQYPLSVFNEIPPQFQEAYTLGLDGKFEIVKRIRDMVRFSRHNIFQDPPFSKVDLISCRNLMIYLGEQLQNDLLPLLHFSLRPDGFIFLGPSENITRHLDLFSAVDQRSRIFRRRETTKRPRINLPLGSSLAAGPQAGPQKMAQEDDFPRYRSLDATNATIYEQYSPPFIRVSNDGRIVDSSGDLSLFLMSRPGDERSIYALARDTIRDLITPLLSEAMEEGRRRAVRDIEVTSPFGVQRTDIVVHPMKDETAAIVFLIKDRFEPIVDEFEVRPQSRDMHIAALQENLDATRLLLKSKVEEIETANEELKSSNEEMMSMNEELQSANEELTTANEELKNKIDELTLANADLDNFVQSSELAMIVLDRNMQIRHVTDAAQRLVPILRSDKGRGIAEFNLPFEGMSVTREIARVAETGEPFSQTATVGDTGLSIFVRITPYSFVEDAIDGVTLTLVDVSEEIKLRHELRFESDRLKLAMRAANMGYVEIDIDDGQEEPRLIKIDEVLADQIGLDEEGDTDFRLFLQNVHSDDRELLRSAIRRAIRDEEPYDVSFRAIVAGRDTRWLRAMGLSYSDVKGRKKVVGPTLDFTEVEQNEQKDLLLNEMSHRIKNLFAVISSVVYLSPKQSDQVQHFADGIATRVEGLSRAYDLVRGDPDKSAIGFGELLERLIKPYVTHEHTIKVEGEEFKVVGDAFNTLSLILHELVTNALKYGALSKPDGTLSLTWEKRDDGFVDIAWSETVQGFVPPAERSTGFGTRIMSIGVEQLRGSFRRTYSKNGADVAMTLRLVSEEGME